MARRAAAAAIALFLTCSGAVQAQEQGEAKTGSIALNQFDPAPTGDKFFGIPSPYAHGELIEPRVQLAFDYAHEPLRLRDENNEGTVVASQIFMHVMADAAIVDRLLVSVLFPVALAQSGDDPTIQGIQVSSPQGSQAGDMRFGLRVRVYGEPETPFQLGTGAFLHVPTGDTTLGEGTGSTGAAYAGEGAVRIQPYLSVGGRFHAGIDWLYTAYGGPFITASDNPSSVRYGAGVAAVFADDIMQIGPEFYAATPLQESSELQVTDDEAISFESSTNAEILLGVRAQLLDFVLGVAGGPGLTKSVGTPAFRLAWSVGYSPAAEVEGDVADDADDDEDFILNRDDACPDAYGKKSTDPEKNGCPVLDDDGDGIPNDEDGCPTQNGIPTEDPRTHGCPPSTARGDGRNRF